MSKQSGGGGFRDFDGELELDSPPPARQPAAETPAPRGTLAPERSEPPRTSPPASFSRGVAGRSELSEAREPSGRFGKVLLLVLAGLAALGGYYIYCYVKAGDRQTAFAGAVMDLRQGLLYLNKKVARPDVEQVLRGYASKAQVELEQLQVTLEPLDENTSRKLSTIAQTALSIAAKLRGHSLPKCVVGFKAACSTKFGLVTKRWVSERYTWFDELAKGACAR